MRFLQTMFQFMFPPRAAEERVRSISYQDIVPLTNPVRIASVPSAVSLLPYQNHLVQTLITEAKFHNNAHAQELLGNILANYLAALNRNGVLVPVPLSKARKRERGYNQAERICCAALQFIDGFSIDTALLVRIKNTTPQTNLGGRARRVNLTGAFSVARPPRADTLYIVVDDVITTGATLSEIVHALKAAGAVHIVPVTLAHSP